MKTIEHEKYYLISYEDDYGRHRVVPVKLWQHYGTAKYNFKEYQKNKWYKNMKIIELDVDNPSKSKILDRWKKTK